MTYGLETLTARNAIKQMQLTVNRELDDLYRERRDHEDLIKNQQEQIMVLRREAENRCADHVDQCVDLSNQRNNAYKIANTSISVMYLACVSAFIAIGYAVWI